MNLQERPADVPAYMDLLSLEGGGYIVLGSGPGMGRQVCHALTQAGAEVLCVDLLPDVADQIAGEVGGHALAADVTQEAGITQVFEEADRLFGKRLAGLVDIVGVANIKPLEEISEAEWMRSFELNVHHAYHALRIGSDYFARNGGGVVTLVGSISGMIAFKRQMAYGVAKAALHHLARGAAHEFADRNIRVNAVAPGFVKTPSLMAKLGPEYWEKIDAATPVGRAAIPSDIASAILFLQSDLAAYVTGNVMVLDGAASIAPSIPQI